jgi:DNA-3-methyladenine glycosylase II
MNSMENLSFTLKPIVPFRLDLTAWALRRRLNNIADRWVDESWRRVLVIRGAPVDTMVTQTFDKGNIILKVNLAALRLDSQIENDAAEAVEKCLGIKADLSGFYQFVSKDEKLNFLANRFCGLKPPRFPTVFEAFVNGVACQEISLNFGIILLNRLVSTYGKSIQWKDTVSYAFPSPEDLLKLKTEDFRKLGFSHQKGRAIIELAQAIISGQVDLEKIKMLNDDEALEQLFQLRGIGPWTADYILLRGLGRLNVFPADDVGGHRNLQRWLKPPGKLSYEETLKVVELWKPYGGLIYFHLLLNRLTEEGYLHEKSSI